MLVASARPRAKLNDYELGWSGRAPGGSGASISSCTVQYVLLLAYEQSELEHTSVKCSESARVLRLGHGGLERVACALD